MTATTKKGPCHRRAKKRRRQPLGHLTPAELLVHRELEYLRVAGSPRPHGRAEQRRREWLLEARRRKLAYAAALVQRAGS
jgi:hypothetical protein